jgi:hypothetical protein
MEQPCVKVSQGPSGGTWELHRSTIKRLYLDEDKPLPKVMEIMQRDHNFKASIKMYKQHLSSWKIDGKNLKRSQVKQIARRKFERDAVHKPSNFFIKGREVDINNVLRNVKKHGFSCLEDFYHAASPVTYMSDVECITPARSPNCDATADQEYEVQNLHQCHHADGQEDALSYSVALFTTEGGPTSPRNSSNIRYFLALSPETRSRQLLSLSPVLRTLALPECLSLPEQMLSTFSFYLKGCFEAGVWVTEANGFLCSNRARNWIGTWAPNCIIAAQLHNEHNYVQLRQLLSQISETMEQCIKFEFPDLLRNLFEAVEKLHVAGLHEISNKIVDHAYNLANAYLGSSHPVSQICSMLHKLELLPKELRSRLLQCQVKHLEQELGLWHPSTAGTRFDLLMAVDSSEAVDRSRDSLAAYKLLCSKHDDTWFDCMLSVADTLTKDRQYEASKRTCEEILDALDIATDLSRDHGVKGNTCWLLSCIAEHLDYDDHKAESFAQQAVVEAVAAWGLQDADATRFMLRHSYLLQKLGRLDEADKIRDQIQGVLGSPIIEELLT